MRRCCSATLRAVGFTVLTALSAVDSHATPPTPEPLPPELQFAADSLVPVMGDSTRARWVLEKLAPIAAKFPHNQFTPQIKFWALIASRAPVAELTAATDTLVGIFASWDRPGDHRGSQTEAHRCLDLSEALLARQEALPIAEQYARKAVQFAETPQTWLYGYSMGVLAEVQRAQGKADSAIVTLHRAIAGLRENEQQTLLKDLRYTLGILLDERGREDEAIATLFASAAIDPSDSTRAADALHGIWKRRFGADADLDQRIERARRIWREWPQGMSLGTLERDPAPAWTLRDSAGREVRSSDFLGKPLVLAFLGTWSDPNRAIAGLADSWYRQRDALGVQVLGIDWELPGEEQISARIADAYARHQQYEFPILGDPKQQAFKAFNARAYPQIFLIDKEGAVRQKVIGFVPDWTDSLTAAVRRLGSSR